ncbi:MAG: hypothetical protein AAF790_10905 [Planctomycetota bacterium]
MSPIESLEQQVKRLSPAELAKFRRWFASYDARAWDEQIEQDASAGKLDAFASEARAEYDAGKASEL